ncbi:MAG: fructosamine kinase family protein, partial [Cyclobacteriaceae bacterium]
SASDTNQFFESVLFQVFGRQLIVESFQFTSGGCINTTLTLKTNEGTFFLKWNQDAPDDMFKVEAKGLQLLKEAGALFIPEVLGYGHVAEKKFLLLEYVDSGRKIYTYWEDFGTSLAIMHKQNSHPQYGLSHDNFIGKLPQGNEQKDQWIDFFIEKRLEVQLQLAIYNRLVDDSFVKRYRDLYPRLATILVSEQPALLHGDLWSGNVMTASDGKVCLIDPAVYFGHREIELAFTTMFGGFEPSFYQAYNEAFPLEPGYQQRFEIYNIYPYMVHVNLFGSAYLSGVERVIRKYR